MSRVAESDDKGAKSLGEPYRSNLLRKLKELRRPDETQTAFAERAGMSQSQMSGIELGTRSVGINVLIRLREHLDVSIDELLGLPETEGRMHRIIVAAINAANTAPIAPKGPPIEAPAVQSKVRTRRE